MSGCLSARMPCSHCLPSGDEREALFGVGAAALLLLFDGIHNAWDNVAYHVLVNLAGKNKEPRRDESDPR
jgi:hypothetical protein